MTATHLLTLTLLVTATTAAAVPESPLVTAVAAFKAQTPELTARAGDITALVEAHLSTNEALQVVERTELDQILQGAEAVLAGVVDATTAPQIGRLTGAKALVTGRCIAVKSGLLVVAKVISTETGKLYAVQRQISEQDDLNDACTKLAADLASTASKHRADLLAPAETADARIVRLKKLLPTGAALPAVFVAVKEEHLSRRVPDPAVQTELQHTLQALGFPIVTDADKAQWRIEGEAFSERGLARGSMVCCRARAELQLRKIGDDAVKVDRQTSVAMDVAEHVAGKTALQNAGAALAERAVAVLMARP